MKNFQIQLAVLTPIINGYIASCKPDMALFYFTVVFYFFYSFGEDVFHMNNSCVFAVLYVGSWGGYRS